MRINWDHSAVSPEVVPRSCSCPCTFVPEAPEDKCGGSGQTVTSKHHGNPEHSDGADTSTGKRKLLFWGCRWGVPPEEATWGLSLEGKERATLRGRRGVRPGAARACKGPEAPTSSRARGCGRPCAGVGIVPGCWWPLAGGRQSTRGPPLGFSVSHVLWETLHCLPSNPNLFD